MKKKNCKNKSCKKKIIEQKIVTFKIEESKKENYKKLADLKGVTFSVLVRDALEKTYGDLLNKLSA